MRRFVCALVLLSVAGACSRARRYELQGQILAIDAGRQEITVKHEDVKGFMPGMTMPFKVKDRRVLADRRPGELIKATLVVADSTGHLEDVVRTGEAPMPADAPNATAAPPLEPGTTVPDVQFLDQNGRSRRLSEWRGKTLAVTFVYTRCPLPDFCPLMDRNFAAVQRTFAADAHLAGRLHLLSVSFDPEYDSPDVLRVHANRARANDETWTWLTGDRDVIDKFAGLFGVSIIRGDRPLQEITHNLRTAILDRDGRLVKIYNGNEWKPEELLAELRATDAR